MRLSLSCVLLGWALLFINCAKDDTLTLDSDSRKEPRPEEIKPELGEVNEPDIQVYFTYSSYPRDADNWIIIHDSEGQLVDYKKIEDGGPVEFSAIKDSIPEKISITEFFYSIDGVNNAFHSLMTYTDINPGSVWNNFHNPPQGNLIGKFSLGIENVPGLKSNILSTPRGPLSAVDLQINGDFNNLTLNLNDIPLYENEDYLLSIYDNSDDHKYIFLTEPKDGLDSIIDYSQFLDYDTYLEIDLPANDFVLLHTYGYADDDPNYFWVGQTFSFNLDFSSPSTIKAGYLENYKRYRTEFSFRNDGYSYSYTKNGTKIENITIPPQPSFALNDDSVYNLSFTSDIIFKTKNTRHFYSFTDTEGINSQTTWSIYSCENSEHRVGELPEEVLLGYPAISLENLELQSVNLSAQGFTHQELFDQMTTNERKGDFTTEDFVFTNF